MNSEKTDFIYTLSQKLTSEEKSAVEKMQNAKKSIIYFEAPTGFGKTFTCLFYSALNLKNKNFKKIFFLSAKKTGLNTILKELDKFNFKEEFSYYKLNNKANHHFIGKYTSCTNCFECKKLEQTRSSQQDKDSYFYLKNINKNPSLLDVQLYCDKSSICPLFISKELINHSDIILLDYNYIFSRLFSSSFFTKDLIENKVTKNALIIIDEAHLLLSRCLENLSFEISYEQISLAKIALQNELFSEKIINKFKNLSQFFFSIKENETINNYELFSLINEIDFSQIYSEENFNKINEHLQNTLRPFIDLKHALNIEKSRFLCISKNDKTISIKCINLGSFIEQKLSLFKQSLLVSASLKPIKTTLYNHNINDQNIDFIEENLSWKNDSYSVAIDSRFDTTFVKRNEQIGNLAKTIEQFTLKSKTRPVIAFFPSYNYAFLCKNELKKISPYLKVKVQDKSIKEDEASSYIENLFLKEDVIFLIMGSFFSESINFLARKSSNCIIVSPSLPKFDVFEEAKINIAKENYKNSAFEKIYIQEGIKKINQALGRFVRNKDQYAKVLLICKRFLDKKYYQYLDFQYKPENSFIINSQSDFDKWLK